MEEKKEDDTEKVIQQIEAKCDCDIKKEYEQDDVTVLVTDLELSSDFQGLEKLVNIESVRKRAEKALSEKLSEAVTEKIKENRQNAAEEEEKAEGLLAD